jgi:hypothetical protein
MSDFSKQYTIEDELKKVRELQYEILVCLVDVVNQSCQTKVDNGMYYVDDMALSAYEGAFDLLERFGILKTTLSNKHYIDWEALERKKP